MILDGHYPLCTNRNSKMPIGMLYEHAKVQNLFALYLGGVQSIPSIRNDSIRSKAHFNTPS